MSAATFHRRCIIVAAVAACSAGLLAGQGLPAGSVTVAAADCNAAELRLTVTGLGMAAGSTYYSIDFTNMSGRTCSLEGYPRASFVSAAGGQIGAAAGRDPVYPVRRVILRPGHAAHARLRVGTPSDYPAPACRPVTVRWLRVYVPAGQVPLQRGFAGMTCAVATTRILGVSRVQPGWGIRAVSPGAMGR